MLKFIVDHNVPKSVGVYLKQNKCDVVFVGDLNPEMTDLEIIKLAQKEDRIIVSNDKDFISLSVTYNTVDMILFDFISQRPDVRIDSLQKIWPQIKQPLGVIVMQ
ncbi:MAG: DUF5615 family PIN-like protein [bacterium]|nr:DUF5615 family PIN-like protein [bacterium]